MYITLDIKKKLFINLKGSFEWGTFFFGGGIRTIHMGEPSSRIERQSQRKLFFTFQLKHFYNWYDSKLIIIREDKATGLGKLEFTDTPLLRTFEIRRVIVSPICNRPGAPPLQVILQQYVQEIEKSPKSDSDKMNKIQTQICPLVPHPLRRIETHWLYRKQEGNG